MNRNTLQIFWVGLFISVVGILYFIALMLHLPFLTVLPFTVGVPVLLYRYLFKSIPTDGTPEPGKKPLLILAGGILLLTGISAILVRKHGDTDALANWNFIAAYLTDKTYWKQLFTNSPLYAHPDYPLGYPATIAFFRQLFHTNNEVISLAITCVPTIAIPALIFIELYRKHLPIAAMLLLVFATDRYYINCGLNQYADTLLAFYILGAFMAMHHYTENKKAPLLLLCTAMLGCCTWVKNEGLIVTGIFGLFYLRTFLSGKNLRYALLGIAPFIIILAIHKFLFAPANDLVAMGSRSMLSYAVDKSRFKLIGQHLSVSFDGNFFILKMCCIAYIAYCILSLKNLNWSFYLLLTIFCCYLTIYLFTPRDLDWHLRTSLDRLIHQLAPAAFFVIGNEISKIRLPLTIAKNTD